MISVSVRLCSRLSWRFRVASCSDESSAPEEFYRGKTIQVLIGLSAGGAYDIYARMLARHMGKHIPGNPRLVPSNMEGAGSLTLTNYLYNVAPKDGTVIGTINRGAPFEPLIGEATLARFDPAQFTWIGSVANEVSICAAWDRAGIDNFDQLFTRELTVGGTGAGADTNQFPRIMNGVLGDEAESRQRLSRRQQYRPRDGARRSGWPLRLVVVEHQVDAQDVARRRARSRCWCSSRSRNTPICRTCR